MGGWIQLLESGLEGVELKVQTSGFKVQGFGPIILQATRVWVSNSGGRPLEVPGLRSRVYMVKGP